MKHCWLVIVGTALPTLLVAQIARSPEGQSERGPYARIAIMRALDGHSVDWEAGYIRHLGWHRQANDPFAWYSDSVWASTERQRWIIYATFGHTAAELSNPISPAEDERDNLINVPPHAQFPGNGIYQLLPAPSRGNGVPTPTLQEANLALLKSLKAAQWKHYGMHSERGRESIEHIVRMFAGHDINHLLQIERIVVMQLTESVSGSRRQGFGDWDTALESGRLDR